MPSLPTVANRPGNRNRAVRRSDTVGAMGEYVEETECPACRWWAATNGCPLCLRSKKVRTDLAIEWELLGGAELDSAEVAALRRRYGLRSVARKRKKRW